MRFVSADEAARLPLRKEPARGGTLRLIDIDGVRPVGLRWHSRGTHRRDRRDRGDRHGRSSKAATRVEFLCGGRVLARFRKQPDVIASAVRRLSVLASDLPDAIDRLQGEFEGSEERGPYAPGAAGGIRGGVVRTPRFACRRLPSRRRTCGGMGCARFEGPCNRDHSTTRACRDPAQCRHTAGWLVVIARAPDVALDGGTILRALATQFGGKGGGRPELAAQGGGFTATPQQLLDAVRTMLAQP